jgi:hypothetical protein
MDDRSDLGRSRPRSIRRHEWSLSTDWPGRRADSGGWAETDPTWLNQVRNMMAHGARRTVGTAGHGMPTTEAQKSA